LGGWSPLCGSRFQLFMFKKMGFWVFSPQQPQYIRWRSWDIAQHLRGWFCHFQREADMRKFSATVRELNATAMQNAIERCWKKQSHKTLQTIPKKIETQFDDLANTMSGALLKVSKWVKRLEKRVENISGVNVSLQSAPE
jgi:hypothetical protein